MTEAAIMPSLMTFLWILASYAAFMANNGIRSCAAARHAAWIHGNAVTKTETEVHNMFYHYPKKSDNIRSKYTRTDGSQNDGGGTVNDIVNGIIGLFSDPAHHYKVEFGVLDKDVDNASEWPFTLMKTKVPVVGNAGASDMPSLLDNLLVIEADCEWERVADDWAEITAIDVILGVAGSAIDAISHLFGGGNGGNAGTGGVVPG